MKNHVSKSTYILSLVIVALFTYIITRETSFKQLNEASISQNSANSVSNSEAIHYASKGLSASSKDGTSVDPYEKEQVKNTIIKNAKNIQKCYNIWLESKPANPKANVKVDWTILPSGKAQSAQIVESTAAALNDCLIQKINEIEFPPPPEGKSFYVAHKFSFDTEENFQKLKQEHEEMEQRLNPLKK